MSSASGSVAIDNHDDANTGNEGTVAFDATVSPGAITVSAGGATQSDIVLSYPAAGVRVTIEAALASPTNQVGTIKFANGTTWSGAALSNLAKASLASPIAGTTGADSLQATGTTLFDGQGAPAGAQDVETGGGGADTFVYNRGYGWLDISEDAGASATTATLRLGAGIQASQVTVHRDGNGTVLLKDGTTGDRIEIDGMFGTAGANPASRGVDQIQFADGSIWSRPQIAAAAITPMLAYYDFVTQAQGTATLSLYTGPVSTLDWQYLWTSTDGVALSTAIPGTFIHAGPSTDAVVSSGGQSVVDGGTGSNFLTGGTDSNHPDTFFVDGRGGDPTWSTISNFHHGDAVTLWGLQAGQSTQPALVFDGAAGYQGATLHSELGGPGTGVNASVTLAGLSVADAQGKLTLLTGTAGTSPYLNIAYTG